MDLRKLVKQNDPRCVDIVRKVGCFLRSCGAIAEMAVGEYLTPEQINALWIWGKQNGHIDDKNMMLRSAPIANEALLMLGDQYHKFTEIGTFQNGRTVFYSGVGERHLVADKYYIQKIKTAEIYGTHFRVVSNEGDVLFDPNDPPIKERGVLYSVIYSYTVKR